MTELNVSYHNMQGEEKKDIRDAWMKAVARTVLPKAETLALEGNDSNWKKFHRKSDKKHQIFFCTPVSKFQKI